MAKGISLPVVQSGLEASIQQGVKNVGKINIPATIDPSAFKNLAQPLGRVSGLATEFEKSIAASNARVLAFGASVGIINGVQNAFADLVKTGIEVQKTLADIAAISGQGGKQLSQFGDALFDVGKATGQSFKTAAQAALEFSRQGLSVEETLKRTTDALTLTRFTSLNAAEAVDVLTAAANSFGESGITTAQIINKLVAVDTKFAVSAEDLANGLARAGSIAQEVGVNFDELNAAITVAQERTARGGAVIGNALKTIFTRLRSDETVQALRDIGVESLNAQGQLKGAIPLLQEVAQKIQGLSGGERIQILEAVASKYNINILSSLLDDLNNANSKFTQAVGVSAGASNQAYERQIELNKTLAAQINAASVSVTQLFNKLSQIGVTDSLATLLKFVSDLINGFNKLIDSEGVGGNIAKGLVKGISDVFFTIGLPIIGAIFIKLTRDIAQFGIESLKTILGINQQVRERQALEQAVVNTLIQDQQVMASILALSGNRAKQEEYLLGVYNRQLNALQQVKNIAATVTPALMAGGLSATTGRIERRGAGGYLPAQEAADVRRGVGGASPSSRVVSIPNFAFGGGKRGTMIANTSEYIVPNFANGGSAIFNRDMARAYGLPAGAKKISAADGYVPNFVGGGGATWRTHYYVNAQGNKITQPKVWDSLSEAEKKQYSRRESYQDLTGKTLSALHPGGAVMLLPTQEMADEVNDKSMHQGVKPKEFKDVADFVKFRAYGFSGSRVKNQVKSEGANEGVAIANIAENIKKVITNEGARVVNLFKPLTKTPISGNEFEKLYDEKGGAAGAAAGVAGSIFEAAMDYSFNNKKSRAAQEAIAAAEANNITFDVLNFKQARTLKAAFGASGSTEAFADYKISPERARTFADQIIKNNVFAKASSGFIPNFAAGSPLGDAINREMAAGVSPSKIRITQDGRLRNGGNPDGLAVINTRDEPNGKIPNFASGKSSPSDIRRAQKRAKEQQAKQDAEDIALATAAAGGSTTVDVTPKKLAESVKKSEESKDNQEKLNLGILKTTAVFGALTSASYMLEGSIKDTDSSILKFTKGLTDTAQKTSLGLTLGEGLKPVVEGLSNKLPGALGTFTKSLAGATPIIGAAIGGLMGLADILEYITTEDKRKGAKTTEEFLGTISGLSTDKQIELVNKKIAEQQDIVSRGEESKQGYLSRADILRKSAVASAGTGAGFAGAVTQMTPEEKKMESQAQAASGSLEILIKRAKELKTAQATQSKTEEEAQNKAIKDANERLVLAKELNNINISFAKRENNLMIDRLRKRIELNNSVILGTQAQKDDVALQQKLIDLEGQKTDANTNAVKQVINQLGTLNSLATVDKGRLKTLMDRVESTQKLEGFEKEIEALGKEGAANARKMIEDQKASLIMTNMQLDAKKQEAELNDRSERNIKARLDREKLITDQILKRMDFQDQLSQERRGFAKESASLGRQLPLRQLEATISGKAFATPEEDLRRLQLQRQVKIEEERAAITEAATKRQEDSYISLKKSILDTVPSLEFLGKKETDNITNRIAQINLIEDQAKKYEELQKFANEFQNKLANKKFNVDFATFNVEEFATNVQALSNSRSSINSALTLQNEILKNGTELDKQRLQLAIDTKTFEEKIAEIRARSKPMAGFARAFGDIEKESVNFSETFAYNTTNAFRDGLRDAMSAAISQTDDLGSALQNVAMNFLKTMQSQFLNQAAGNITTAIGKGLNITGMAKGGIVTGGSGYRDDVPAMLTGGEFVMRKSAVQKYGAANLAKMNNGGIFLPGVRGGGNITGYDQLRAFANQTTTSGATDVLRGGGSSAFINLEDQSSRLSRFGLLNEDTINQEIRSAQEQGLDIIAKREAYRTQQRKAFQQQLVGTIASAALSAGIGKLMAPAAKGLSKLPISYGASANPASYGPMAFGPFTGAGKGMFKAYGGMIRRYASGGPTDDIPALLMSGEYVMNRGATSKYGKRLLDSMNQGRAPRFADGGEVGASTTTTESNAKMMGDVSININVTGQNSQTETQGNTSQGGIDYKKMSERIKAVVLETINEEKRLGGALRTR